MKKGVMISCDNCKKIVYRAPWQIKRKPKNNFCDFKCKSEWMVRKIPSGENSPYWSSIKIECDNCKKEFYVELNQLKRSQNHFCNFRCKAEWMMRNISSGENSRYWSSVKVNCDNCKKEFYIQPYRIKENKKHFCDVKCHSQWQSENMKGLSNFRYKKVQIECVNCERAIFRAPWHMRRSKNQFCNKECFDQWQSVNKKGEKTFRIKVACANCNKDLFRQSSRVKKYKNQFCDFKCLAEWRSKNIRGKNSPCYKRIEIKCGNCNKIISRAPWQRQSKNQFCNQQCYSKWQSINLRGKNNLHWKSIKFQCDNCEKEFYVEPNRSKRGKNHFCSKKCKYEWMSKNLTGKNNLHWSSIEVKCSKCEKIFHMQPNQLKIGKRHFCNKNCMTQFLKGPNSPGWKNGLSFEPYSFDWTEAHKKFIRRRDNWKCQLCGAPQEEFTKKLSVHHIDYNKKNCDKKNLITLCALCHNKTNANRNLWISLFKIKIVEIYSQLSANILLV